MSNCEHPIEFLKHKTEETDIGGGWRVGRDYIFCEVCSASFLPSEQNLFKIINSARSSHLKLKEEVKTLSDTVEDLRKQLSFLKKKCL